MNRLPEAHQRGQATLDAQRQVKRPRDRITAYSILLVAVGVILLAHWPGRLNGDSEGMYAGVRGDRPIVDHWTATLTWLWQKAHQGIGLDTGGVFLLQTVGLITGLYLVLRCRLGRMTAASVTLLIGLAPPAFGFVGLVGRDAWFVGACALAVGLAVGATRWTQRRHRATAIVLGIAAAAVAITARQNAFTAVAPIVACLVAVAIPLLGGRVRLPPRQAVLTTVAVGGLATIVILAATALTDRATRDRALHPEHVTYLYDLGYLTLSTSERLIPRLSRAVLPAQTPAEVERRWQPTTALYLRVAPPGSRGSEAKTRIFLTATEAESIARAWREAVTRHPTEYLRGRFGLWRHQIGIGHTPLYSRAPPAPPTSYGYEPPAFPELSELATDYASAWGTGTEANLNGGAIHHVWPYLLVCVLGLLLLLPRFRLPVRMAATLPAAALGLQVGLFFLAPSVQWRYQLLTVYAAMVVVALFVTLAIDALRSDRHALRGPLTQRP